MQSKGGSRRNPHPVFLLVPIRLHTVKKKEYSHRRFLSKRSHVQGVADEGLAFGIGNSYDANLIVGFTKFV